jgi:hypothetical protein
MGPKHIRSDEFARGRDRTIHMAFSREMHDRIRPELREQIIQESAVANVTLYQPISRMSLDDSE